jgi:flavin reductase (DIM6/NTAB) family NADH-FMN oxidoreductase RutF/DNA-binding GntR family transcriptional regulator
MTTSAGAHTAVSDHVFKDVIGRFASGVTVITTSVDGADFGTTASAVSSLSMDPPMLLICLNRTSDTQAAILQAGTFGVNILAEHQGQVAYQFAKKGQDKFRDVGIDRGRTGVPLVRDALAHIECSVEETVTGGTHTVFLARVTAAAGREGEPLTYFRGRFGRLESVLDEAAYRALRQRVIDRTLPVGRPLDLDALAVELEVDPQRVFYALTKLSTDGLVERRDDGYVVTPLTAEAAGQLFDARCTVEIGVVDQTVGTASEEALDELEHRADDLARIVHSQAPDLTAFLATSHAFHRQLVALAGCPQLSESYDRLGIPAFWSRAMAERRWWEDFDVAHHAQLVAAYRGGDPAAAKRLIVQHRDQVKSLVHALITEAGGEV